MRRAAHQLFDHPLVHDDPLALRMVAEADVAALRADPNAAADSRALRAFLAVRSRVAEDALADAVARGVRRYVLLGAGLDTFAYRNPHPDVRVFEVDHPDTQVMSGDGSPTPASPCPTASRTSRSTSRPTRSGPRCARPASTPRRSSRGLRDAVPRARHLALATLDAVAPFAAGGGGVVFEIRDEPLAQRRRAFAALSARVAAAGEPFRSAFEPSALRATLERIGFRTIDDLGPQELTDIFVDRADGLAIMGGAHRVTAIGQLARQVERPLEDGQFHGLRQRRVRVDRAPEVFRCSRRTHERELASAIIPPARAQDRDAQDTVRSRRPR